MSSDAHEPQENVPEAPGGPATPENPVSPGDSAAGESAPGAPPRRRILIGSQRDPAAYRPKPKRDWVSPRRKDRERRKKEDAKPPRGDASRVESPATEPPSQPEVPPLPLERPQEPLPATPLAAAAPEAAQTSPGTPPAPRAVAESVPAAVDSPAIPSSQPVPAEAPAAPAAVDSPAIPSGQPVPAEAPAAPAGRPERGRRGRREPRRDRATLAEEVMKSLEEKAGLRRVPLPSLRNQLPADLEEEFQQALSDASVDSLMTEDESVTRQGPLEPESRHVARVVAVHREDVFVELGGREQGTVPARLFPEPPQPGATFEAIVTRFNPEEGLYEMTLPGAAAQVGDWSQVAEGMLVDARVTGHNTGGLECEVNRIRGFIPVSQISLYRVENLAEFVDQKFTCLVTEANPERRNLVLSRRAVLEREKEEARKTLLESLAPGQIREGVVRKLMDFGAFVDLGGVDGLLHVSQMGWGRVQHPREVVQEGQSIRVRIDKVNRDTGRISLGYREMLENPWTNADGKYLAHTVVRGRVVKLMDFGAFVELEPGVEGLVHISELAHRRVARTSDVVKEGEEVDVMILSVDVEARRISLSMKSVLAPPEPESPVPTESAVGQDGVPPSKSSKPRKSPAQTLQGGLGKSPRGKSFGLKR